MVTLTRDEQKQITSDHLKGGMATEIWLIPFAVTLSIMLVVILIMVLMHFLNRSRGNDSNPKDYKQANTDSDEMLTFTARADTDVENDQPTASEFPKQNGNVTVVESRRVHPDIHNDSTQNGWSNNYNHAQLFPDPEQPWSQLPASDL